MSQAVAALTMLTASAFALAISMYRWLVRRGSLLDNLQFGLAGIGGILISVSNGALGPVSDTVRNITFWSGTVTFVFMLAAVARRNSTKARDREEIR